MILGTQLVLAGGGHSHVLLLALGDAFQATTKWVDHPRKSPSTSLYSGMVPGLIAGLYSRDQIAIDLRRLAAEAGVAFVQAEIRGLDTAQKSLLLSDRLPLPYSQLSIDVGAVSRPVTAFHL